MKRVSGMVADRILYSDVFWRSELSKRQTVFFLPIDPRDKGHQDPAQIDFTVVLGGNIKTRYFGLILILRFKKD